MIDDPARRRIPWRASLRALPPALVVLATATLSHAAPGTSEQKLVPPNRLSQTIADLKASGQEFKPIALFRQSATPVRHRPDLRALVSEGTLLSLDAAAMKAVLAKRPQHFTLPIPAQGALELVQVDYSGLVVEGPHGEDLSAMHTATHYQGTVQGQEGSLAAISVFRNPETGAYEVAGVYSTPAEGNVLIGRVKGRNPANEHLVYRDSAVRERGPVVECGLDEVQDLQAPPAGDHCPWEPPFRAEATPPRAPQALLARCLRLHYEVEHDVYLRQGANTANYATGFFNIGRTVYANEGIPLTLHYLKVWTTPDPEANINGYQQIWNHFWNRMYQEGIRGDLAMLVGFHIDRGIAALNRICGPDYNQAGISPIRDYPGYPTYSWASATFPHEIGHLFGSPHTQSCAWNGNNTALDGCAPPEGSCARPSSQFGTIMSYCSNFSLAQGFGTQPGNLIRNSYGSASCVIDCGGTGCTNTISPTSASVGAGGGSGTVTVTTSSPDCTWTSSSSAGWITITAGGGTRTGNGSISYSVAANTGPSSRTGTLTVAGRTFTVSQAGGGGAATALANGVSVGVSGGAGSQTLFYIDVPSGATNLAITTSGGSGDLDLYTRFASPPTTTTYDCRPYTSSNNETCSVAAPQAGRYYVMLHGYTAYAGASLRGSFTPGTVTTVRVISPNGGESWTRGSTRTISWTTTNSQRVDVALYKGTTFVQWITWSAPSSAGSYNWTLPGSLTPGSDYKITILDYNQRQISDSSDGSFSIN
jgi:hypothetical protein